MATVVFQQATGCGSSKVPVGSMAQCQSQNEENSNGLAFGASAQSDLCVKSQTITSQKSNSSVGMLLYPGTRAILASEAKQIIIVNVSRRLHRTVDIYFKTREI